MLLRLQALPVVVRQALCHVSTPLTHSLTPLTHSQVAVSALLQRLAGQLDALPLHRHDVSLSANASQVWPGLRSGPGWGAHA
jgi:hypothetical protein